MWFYTKTRDIPLIKCIKCNNYICKNCTDKNECRYCPFKCHELNEEGTPMDY